MEVAFLSAAAGAVLDLDVDVDGYFGAAGGADVESAEFERGWGGGGVDAASALHVDDGDLAGLAGLVDDVFEGLFPARALLQLPHGVDRFVLDAQLVEPVGKFADEGVVVHDDPLGLAGAHHLPVGVGELLYRGDVGGHGGELGVGVFEHPVGVDCQSGFVVAVDFVNLDLFVEDLGELVLVAAGGARGAHDGVVVGVELFRGETVVLDPVGSARMVSPCLASNAWASPPFQRLSPATFPDASSSTHHLVGRGGRG